MSMAHEHIGRPLALIGDVAGIGIIAGSWMGYLPDIAALFAALYYIAQFYESKLGRKLGVWISGHKSPPTP